ncbi:MAG: ferritin-like domain-containing protein [Wolinella sp.]
MQEDNQNISTPQMTQNEAIAVALDDEFHAFETYKAIAIKFQSEFPFGRIAESEARHIDALLRAATRLGVTIPPNRWAGTVSAPTTLEESYALGVNAEIENIALYDRLLPFVDDAEVRDIFYSLQAASYNNHLPAFRAHLYRGNQAPAWNEMLGSLMPQGVQLSEKITEAEGLMQKLSKGEASSDDIGRFLQGIDASFIGGLVTGGLGAMILSELMSKHPNNE